jgi:hypothetical protein
MLLANKINKLSSSPHHQLLKCSINSSTSSYSTLNVLLMSCKSNTCMSCLGTRNLLLLFYSEGLNMGGNTKIFTPAVIKRAPPFPYLRLKVGTVSAASPLLSGKMSTPASLFLTLIPSSSTSLPPVYSKGVNTRGSTALLLLALGLNHQISMSMS